MNAPICCAIAQKTAIDASTFADIPEFGHGEVAERPIAVPKVSRTNEIAAASTAPASTGPHSTKLGLGLETAVELTGAGPTCVMAFLSQQTRLVKPKKAQDEQDDDHKADEIDDAVHGWSPRVQQSTDGLCGFRQRA
jgi:hypothetical protein